MKGLLPGVTLQYHAVRQSCLANPLTTLLPSSGLLACVCVCMCVPFDRDRHRGSQALENCSEFEARALALVTRRLLALGNIDLVSQTHRAEAVLHLQRHAGRVFTIGLALCSIRNCCPLQNSAVPAHFFSRKAMKNLET